MSTSVLDEPMTISQADKLISLLEVAVPALVEQAAPGVMTVKEAAARWNLNEENVRRLCTTGQIKAFKLGCQWRVPRIENEHVNKGR